MKYLAAILAISVLISPMKAEEPAPMKGYQTQMLEGWTLRISDKLLEQNKTALDVGLPILKKQLEDIVRLVPAEAVTKLRTTPIFLTPPPDGKRGTAEYHDSAAWLRANGRDPAMAKAVQVSDVADLQKEADRMPAVMLHELAHSYHDKFLKWEQPDILAAYNHAKAAKLYDRVERWHGTGIKTTFERAYAMTNHKEYFAEVTEAYFSRNDFFPFTREELKKHDPDAFAAVEKVWGVK